ncbi:hypothetical protein [Blastococcus brunescens]|uniref:Uncharacterized protein n=1 Tax=Blastococcus brunescens TaxID=1564165 RepID=A0ABZ1B5H1_9ACTN|nr:hypothetical protein [Blastococcus sp. BMG 8361]WRL64270.1 hypothetical protein U6N30_32805 [Blastococcus sp. BMG 8361]
MLAVVAVVVGLLAVPAAAGVVLAGTGLAVLVGFQAALWSRQRRLTGRCSAASTRSRRW